MIHINDLGEMEIQNIVPIFRGNRIIKFITSVSIHDINNVYDRLVYDEETQRGFKEKRDKKKTKIVRIENKKNIREMEMKIREDFFDGGFLTWCIRISEDNDQETFLKEYEYIPEEAKLIISKDKLISLPDSAQRHTAIHNLKGYTTSLNQETYCFPLQICLYDLMEEKSFFAETNGEGQRAYRSRSLYLSNAFKSMLLKNIINESKLNNNVEVKNNSVAGTDNLTTFATLYNSLFDSNKGTFRYINEDDVKDVQEWLIKFFNHLIEVRPELEKLSKQERVEIMNSSIVTNAISITAFAFIAKYLKGNQNWKRNLEKLNKPYKAGLWTGDIFSIENPLWHGTICSKGKDEKWKVNNSRRSVEFMVDILTKYLNITKI